MNSPGLAQVGADSADITDDRSDVMQRLSIDQTQALHRATPRLVMVGMAFALVVTALVWHSAPPAMLATWLGLRLLVVVGRLADHRRFRAKADQASRQRYWRRRLQAWLLVDGLVWAAMVPMFQPGASALVQSLLLCGALAVATVSMLAKFSDLPTALLVLGAVGLPQIVYFLQMATLEGVGAAAAVALHMVAMAAEARHSQRRMNETLRLRHEVAVIAEERSRALRSAEAADQAKGRFLAAVSHEMRTPLHGILGMTQLLRDELGPPHRARVDVVQRSAEHLHRVIDDLLHLSRIEFGRQAIQPMPMATRQAVAEVFDLLTPMADQAGLQLRLAVDAALPEQVLADAARVRQVLHNLLGNAIKFTAQGEVVMAVHASAPGQVCIEVRDTGPGIAAADLQRIFDPFEQLDPGHNRAGTGLGLAIARTLARAMGGDLTCQSAPGQGSTFRFTFAAPLAPAAAGAGAAAPTPQSHSARGAASSPPAQASALVLVVDDNEVNAMVATAMLDRLGVRSQVVGDGVQALQAMARGGHQAVLMDCQMPLLDGWEATRRWRSMENAQRLPIIGVTANASADTVQDCLNAGMDDHLPKPFLLQDLKAKLLHHAPQLLIGAPAPQPAPRHIAPPTTPDPLPCTLAPSPTLRA